MLCGLPDSSTIIQSPLPDAGGQTPLGGQGLPFAQFSFGKHLTGLPPPPRGGAE